MLNEDDIRALVAAYKKALQELTLKNNKLELSVAYPTGIVINTLLTMNDGLETKPHVYFAPAEENKLYDRKKLGI